VTARPHSRRNPWKSLLRVLWRQPLWAIPFALFFGTLYGGSWMSYVLSFRVSLVFSFSIGLALWAIGQFVEPRIERSDLPDDARGWRVGLAYTLGALLASWAASVIVHLTVMPGMLGSPRAVLVALMFSVVFVALFSGIHAAISFYRTSVERAKAVEQTKRQLAEAELRALRAQIHPHFLFNTLNSIASLIASDPAEAEDVVTRLAELFRYTLQASDREHSPLEGELDFVRNYLEIERARFGDRLRLREAIEPGLAGTPVPSLLLQPLVENAVHHAVSAHERGATIELGVRREGDRLVLEVADDGPGIEQAPRSDGTGFGLHSVRERLRVLGPPHEIQIESAPGRGTRVRVHVPLPGRSSHLKTGGVS
jgi:signal transduction histidine kinase